MSTKTSTLPPVKIAVMIDGGFFVKRFNALYNKERKMNGAEVADYLYTLAHLHIGNENTLYRIFYYDCYPFAKNNNWHLHTNKVKELLKGTLKVEDIKEEDVYIDIRQKGIDMKIGVDIASMALKKFVDRIVLVSGDADFVPAAKLARREGIDFILDPMKARVEPSLFEHIDGMDCPQIYIKKTK